MLSDVCKKNEEIKLVILYEDDFKIEQKFKPTATISDLKNFILRKLNMYSINYIIEFNDRDYSRFDNFKFHEIFLIKRQEYEVKIKNVETYVKEQQQKVLITYEEGGEGHKFIIFKQKTNKLEIIAAETSNRIKFEKFPYNSRSCHVIRQNKLIISGGVNNETAICSYDFDLNYLMDLPAMNYQRQQHSMINVDEDRVFMIGGSGSNAVECLSLEFEDYTKYPNMHYDRKDPSVCLVNNKFLYVFSGYSQECGEVAKNFETLNISEEPFDSKWHLMPMNNPYDFIAYRVQSAVVSYNEGFLFLGGLSNYKCTKEILYFDLVDFKFTISKFSLPFPTAFPEKSFVNLDVEGSDCYLFNYGSSKLIKYDKQKSSIHEVITL